MVCKYFLPFCRLLVHSVDCFFHCTDVFKFDVVPFISFCFRCHIQVIIAKSNVMKLSPYVFFQEFYSFRSYVFVFNPFWINFCISSKVRVQFHFFACGYPVSQPHLLKILFFTPLCSLGTFDEHLMIYMRVYFWILCFVPLICMSVFMLAQNCFDYSRFVLCFEIRKCETSSFVFLSPYCFGYLGSFEIPCEF